MECEYCGAELDDEGPFGRYLGTQYEELNGYIYRCPNSEGFETEEEALAYEPQYIESIEDLEKEDPISWEEICCDSNCHNVSGSFYSDRNDNLHSGYPC